MTKKKTPQATKTNKRQFLKIQKKLHAGGYTSLTNFKRGLGHIKITASQSEILLAEAVEYFHESSDRDPTEFSQPKPNISKGLAVTVGINPDTVKHAELIVETDINMDLLPIYSNLKAISVKYKLAFNEVILRLIQIRAIERVIRNSPDLGIDE